MNTETREIRDDLTPAEMLDGKWVRIAPKMAKKYEAKQPVTDEDFKRIVQAEAKRLRKNAARLDALATPRR